MGPDSHRRPAGARPPGGIGEGHLTTRWSLEAEIGQALLGRGWTLAVAESCTGGLLSHRLTNVPGSSRYFLGGVVSYANEAKRRLLGVDAETLATHGAVSPQTAREMAQAARHLFQADVAVAVTGIAGPGGGTPQKPVGLVFLHLSAPDAEWSERHQWAGGREANKAQSAEAALLLLWRYLKASSQRGKQGK
ncbi:MAG: CinA family protein [Anaerolineae bacterium]|nr:CinA family protein [Anaerolineae bacterium]